MDNGIKQNLETKFLLPIDISKSVQLVANCRLLSKATYHKISLGKEHSYSQDKELEHFCFMPHLDSTKENSVFFHTAKKCKLVSKRF